MEQTIRRFLASETPCGDSTRELAIGDRALRFEGLSEAQARGLEHFWGPYLSPSADRPIQRTIRVCRGGPGHWLAAPQAGELYRVEPCVGPHGVIALSYAFAVGPDGDGAWRVTLADDAIEPAPQSLENAARLCTARMAIELGGFAMHSAAVEEQGRAWVFAGPSGAGKSTAVRNSPGRSLGDDFGLVIPDDRGGWQAPPLPFDNAPASGRRPVENWFPVAGVWRLFQSEDPRVERPTGLLAETSLLTCAALPWAMPDLATAALENVGRFCQESYFGHLYLADDARFWAPLKASTEALD